MTDPTIRGLLFDKDGTLIDFQATWVPLNVQAADVAAKGDPALRARLLEIGGYDAETGRVTGASLLAQADTREVAEAWVDAGAPFGVDELAAAMDRIFQAGMHDAVPVTNIAELFRRLWARGLHLGIATSDSEAAIAASLAGFGVSGERVHAYGYDSGHGSKPDPGMVHAFCAATGLDPAQVAMVGDNLHDIHAGQAAGCGLTVGVRTGTGGPELADAADFVIADIGELEALLGDRIPPLSDDA
ncbi:phosphoglycolate phosphatase [Limimonas halophila]|uniref:phosphoglycolate phosphatase n=1 Tax=Limimonas halophila TaxID=1082479 RepID=A0A1G7LKE3_9PROT|nr:HAD family hydrolase [Limimonas halophila]SDF49846.1 phosphoglycolate phosphatase [Limimonas halophila]